MPTDILRHRSDPVARRAAAPEATASQHGPGSRVILIRAGRIELEAALAATATAERIWAALPLFGVAEPWGEAIHFEIPIASGRDRTARLMARPGDICLWSEERRIILPFGPTPISRPGEMRMPAPVNVFATALGDVKVLQGVRVGEKVSLLRRPGEGMRQR